MSVFFRSVNDEQLKVFFGNKFHNYTTSNSTYFYVSTTIDGLLQELNGQWSLKKAVDGGRNVEVSRIASCVIMKLFSNNILPT